MKRERLITVKKKTTYIFNRTYIYIYKCIIATNSFMCVITIFRLYNMEENCLMLHLCDR